MSNKPNHRRDHGRIQDHGPTYESHTPSAGCNSPQIARGRARWKRTKSRAERRVGAAIDRELLGDAEHDAGLERMDREIEQYLEAEARKPTRWQSLWPVAGRVTSRSFSTRHGGLCGELPACSLVGGRKPSFVRGVKP